MNFGYPGRYIYIYIHNILHILSYVILYYKYITYYLYAVWILRLWFRIQTIRVIFDHKSLLGSFSITHQSSKEKNFSSNGVLSPEWFSPRLNFQHSTWGKTQVYWPMDPYTFTFGEGGCSTVSESKQQVTHVRRITKWQHLKTKPDFFQHDWYPF